MTQLALNPPIPKARGQLDWGKREYIIVEVTGVGRPRQHTCTLSNSPYKPSDTQAFTILSRKPIVRRRREKKCLRVASSTGQGYRMNSDLFTSPVGAWPPTRTERGWDVLNNAPMPTNNQPGYHSLYIAIIPGLTYHKYWKFTSSLQSIA